MENACNLYARTPPFEEFQAKEEDSVPLWLHEGSRNDIDIVQSHSEINSPQLD